MQHFFASKLGAAANGVDGVFVDWANLIDASSTAPDTGAWSVPEAFYCVLLAAAVCDYEFAASERELVRFLAHRSKALGSLSDDQLNALHQVVADRIGSARDAAMQAAATLPEEMRLPTFAHALDVTLADGDITEAEAAFLDNLIKQLKLARADVERVADVILLKNQC